MKAKSETASATASATQAQNPKSLVMVDSAGKMATLKLTTSTGLHFYDGTMLWVNPAQTVTANAPRPVDSGLGQANAFAPNVVQSKSTKALAIVDPKTGDELVVKKPDPPPPPPAAPSAAGVSQAQVQQAPVRTQPTGFPLMQMGQMGPLLNLPSTSMVPSTLLGGGMAVQTLQPQTQTASAPPILIHPSSTQQLFPQQTAPSSAPSQPSAPERENNVIDLLAKATKTSAAALLNSSQPLFNASMPPSYKDERGNRDRDRDRDWDDRYDDRGKGKGKGGKGAAKGAPAEGKGKGKGGKSYNNTYDQKPRKNFVVKNPEKYAAKDAKYTASLDGRFWSLSCWPEGNRDDTHGLTFGKHKLEVLKYGVVRVKLYGGVNKYDIRLHLAKEGDELGASDKDGWTLASCEPNAANLKLSEDADRIGWKIIPGDHPLIYPPGLEDEKVQEVVEIAAQVDKKGKPDEKSAEEAKKGKADDKPAAEQEKTEEKTEEKAAEKTEEKTEEKAAEKTEEKAAEKTDEKVEEKTEEKAEKAEEKAAETEKPAEEDKAAPESSAEKSEDAKES